MDVPTSDKIQMCEKNIAWCEESKLVFLSQRLKLRLAYLLYCVCHWLLISWLCVGLSIQTGIAIMSISHSRTRQDRRQSSHHGSSCGWSSYLQRSGRCDQSQGIFQFLVFHILVCFNGLQDGRFDNLCRCCNASGYRPAFWRDLCIFWMNHSLTHSINHCIWRLELPAWLQHGLLLLLWVLRWLTQSKRPSQHPGVKIHDFDEDSFGKGAIRPVMSDLCRSPRSKPCSRITSSLKTGMKISTSFTWSPKPTRTAI